MEMSGDSWDKMEMSGDSFTRRFNRSWVDAKSRLDVYGERKISRRCRDSNPEPSGP
jgi:hypothetical protein